MRTCTNLSPGLRVLATPLGINSTTGVAGLTLGGGFGWTTRKFGLTIDNLLSAGRPSVGPAKGRDYCQTIGSSPHAVKLAREHDLLVAVRAGGHNIAGNAVCDGGLLIDLSLMKSVRVDPASRTARVEPGATLADFDREAQAFGSIDSELVDQT